MKLLKIFLQLIKWIFIVFILLFALSTGMVGSLIQTILLVSAATVLIYWPERLITRFGKSAEMLSRSAIVLVLIILTFTVFSGGPKTSIYTSEENETELMKIYDESVRSWPADTEDVYVQSEYGTMHLLTCGSKENPPLIMFHAASMGAHSWKENIEPLLNDYCIYSFDNLGEGNKSNLNDPTIFPKTGKELADLYVSVLDSLNIEKAPVFGASNGGFIAQMLTYHYPERVESLLLFAPMGLTQLTKGSIMMMTLSSMYPFSFIRDNVTEWAIGNDPYVLQTYGNWFECILKGCIPSMAGPVPMTKEQKRSMDMPILLFLGTQDKIVGDVDIAKKTALDYPNIQIEISESGHLIAVEERAVVNKKVSEFLHLDPSLL